MASLMSYITPASVMSNICMYRKKEPDRAFLLVEGDSDIGFYKNIIHKKTCRIISLSGKEKVEKAIRILNEQQIEGVMAVTDRDYDELLGQLVEEPNLYTTDTHDMETMILKTGAFERFVNEFGDDDRIEAFEREKERTVLEEILDIASRIGTLRFLNMKRKWGAAFRGVELNRYMTDSLELLTEEFLDTLLYNEEKRSMRLEIEEELETELAKGHDPWQVSRGHDMTQLIAIFFSRKCRMTVGNARANGLNGRDVELAIRLAYRREDFQKSNLYKQMEQWQREHQMWIVLRHE